jgi:hypothetical protein
MSEILPPGGVSAYYDADHVRAIPKKMNLAEDSISFNQPIPGLPPFFKSLAKTCGRPYPKWWKIRGPVRAVDDRKDKCNVLIDDTWGNWVPFSGDCK